MLVSFRVRSVCVLRSWQTEHGCHVTSIAAAFIYCTIEKDSSRIEKDSYTVERIKALGELASSKVRKLSHQSSREC